MVYEILLGSAPPIGFLTTYLLSNGVVAAKHLLDKLVPRYSARTVLPLQCFRIERCISSLDCSDIIDGSAVTRKWRSMIEA